MTQPTQKTQPWHNELRNRYIFEGNLEMRTGLHIGGGSLTISNSNSPVVLAADGLPFIPGSSFKGILRSTVEKFVLGLPADLGLHTCGLPLEENPDESCPTAHQKTLQENRGRSQNQAKEITNEERKNLCHTCLLFGSPFSAARLIINDLYLVSDDWSEPIEIRDGVAIDRDSETAKNGLKYDFEVVPSTTTFRLHLTIENATDEDLQLISIGLGEFTSGFASIGGLRSRGLGACILKDLQIRKLDLTDKDRRKDLLKQYLLRKKDNFESGLEQVGDTEGFFNEQIERLFKERPAHS